jgi:SAM-dependent methyltransferase
MNKTLTWQQHRGAALDVVEPFTVIACEPCGFRHIVPIPTPAELADVYRHEYYTVEKPLYLERVREDLEWWNLVYDEWFDAFEALLPAGRRRILDVGSGPGYFLLNGKRRGWTTLGMEPSSQAVAHSRGLGLEIVQDFFSAASAQALGTFDVVHLSEVLEHIPDPAGVLDLAHRVLNPGGLVSLMVPNDYSPFQDVLRRVCHFRPWWVAPPHHINYFDFDSLHRLLDRRFEVVSTQATFPIDLFLLMGDNYVGDDRLGRICHGKRKALELNLAAAGLSELKQRLYRAMAELNIGRDIVMVGRKRDVAPPGR